MKSLKNIKTVVVDGKVTITADIEERQFGFPSQQVTVLHLADNNQRWARHAQISNEAFFVKRRQFGVAFPIEEMITQVATVIEPNLSYPALFKKYVPTPDTIVADLDSELHPAFQWKIADNINDPEEKWIDIEGATTPILSRKDLPPKKWVRCKAVSDAGVSWTPPTISQ